MLTLHKDYKKINHPELKYELIKTQNLVIPNKEFSQQARAYLRANPVPVLKDYIEIKNGIMSFEVGYRWDGCSGPTWDTAATMEASLAHDGLYQLMRLAILAQNFKDFADRWFLELMLIDGAWRIRAYTFYNGVKYLGAKYCALDPIAIKAMNSRNT
jgi:hypothetical protein